MMMMKTAFLLLSFMGVSAVEIPGTLNDAINIDNNDHDAALVGDRCGLLSGNDCKAGLECSHLAAIAGKRCIPRRDCVGETLQSFMGRPQFAGYKDRIFRMANITEMDVLKARMDHVEDHTAFLKSDPMQAMQTAVLNTTSEFEELGPLMQRCVQPESKDRNLLSRNLANDTDPDPNQANGTSPVVFIGAHLEAGAILDASFSVLWQSINGGVQGNARVSGRVCGGLEIGAGLEISFITVVGFTPDPNDLDCLNVLLDADIAPFFTIGAGFGICVSQTGQNTLYVEGTIGTGVGGGVGISLCENIPFNF